MTTLVRSLGAAAARRACPRTPHSKFSRLPPTGARSRRSWAATRSMSTSPPPRCRTCTASMRSRASSRARARRISSSRTGARARDRLAAGAAAGVWQPAHPAGQPGLLRGYLDREAPGSAARLDRSMGDVHPHGNPHIQLDPRNIAAVAKALTRGCAQLDRSQCAVLRSARRGFPGDAGSRRSPAGKHRPRRSRA